jgi:hypothetical protein
MNRPLPISSKYSELEHGASTHSRQHQPQQSLVCFRIGRGSQCSSRADDGAAVFAAAWPDGGCAPPLTAQRGQRRPPCPSTRRGAPQRRRSVRRRRCYCGPQRRAISTACAGRWIWCAPAATARPAAPAPAPADRQRAAAAAAAGRARRARRQGRLVCARPRGVVGQGPRQALLAAARARRGRRPPRAAHGRHAAVRPSPTPFSPLHPPSPSATNHTASRWRITHVPRADTRRACSLSLSLCLRPLTLQHRHCSYLAAQNGNLGAVAALISAGADTETCCGPGGMRPQEVARKRGHAAVGAALAARYLPTGLLACLPACSCVDRRCGVGGAPVF